ncbi:MAG: hypothetical protein FAF03_12090 [Epsilonproteobacteria bacterium]|nr:hypothetical protein [Campylobacterota bacterium]
MLSKKEIFGKFIIKALRDVALRQIEQYIKGFDKTPEHEWYQNKMKELNFTQEQKELMMDLVGSSIDGAIGACLHALRKGKYSAIKKEKDIDMYQIIPEETVYEIFGDENDVITYREWKKEYSQYPFSYSRP